MSRLLIEEQPRLVLPSLAVAIGLNEAMLLQQIYFWSNLKNNHKIYEGRRWVYNSYNAWHEEFPFFSLRTVKRALKSLTDQKLLLVGHFSTSNTDRTNWYAIDFNTLNALQDKIFPLGQNDPIPLGQNDPIDSDKMAQCLKTERSKTETKKENIDRAERDLLASSAYPAGFEKLWKLHSTKCKKGSKPKAFAAFKSQLKKNKGLTADDLYLKLRAQFAERDFKVKMAIWVADIPHLSSWLTGERYNDGIQTEQEILAETKDKKSTNDTHGGSAYITWSDKEKPREMSPEEKKQIEEELKRDRANLKAGVSLSR